jgi:pSer/pThr/pTyr-binding forkhead associated (FHA) protein
MGPIPGRAVPPEQPAATEPPPAPSRSARLRLLNGPQAGRIIELPQTEATAGRSDPPSVTVEIDLTECELSAVPVVSRRHARFCWVEDALMLQDLGSTNGTRINGSVLRAEQARSESDLLELHSGDRILLANLEFELVID